jgi:hypothetical protein
MEIPASVTLISIMTDYNDNSNRELIFPSGTRIEKNAAIGASRAFVVYQDIDDVKQRRRRIQLGTFC